MLGFLVLLYCIIDGWRRGKPAPANPWHAKSLEWKVPTPVPLVNFLVDPVVTSDPYGFGEPEPDGSEEQPDPDRELVPTFSSDRPVSGGEVL
jgi:heme/copper-type cytochrome/quinol oxidase subunit 1